MTSTALAALALLGLGCGGDGRGTTWLRGFGSAENDLAFAIAIDSKRNVVLTGATAGTIDFGGPVLVAKSGFDLVAAALDERGDHVWSLQANASESNQNHTAVAALPSGGIALAGTVQGSLDFGGPPFTSSTGPGVFAVKLDAAGKVLWSGAFSGTSMFSSGLMAADLDNNVILAGKPSSSIDLGGGPLSGRVFVAKLDSNGQHLWSKAFTGMSITPNSDSDAQPIGLAATRSGDIAVLGYYSGILNLGEPPLENDNGDFFVAMFSASGELLWVKSAGGAPSSFGATGSITADDSDGVVVAGPFSPSTTFGSTTAPHYGEGRVLAAKLDKNGNVLWLRHAGDAQGSAIAVDDSGHITVGGNLGQGGDLGSGETISQATTSGDFVARYGADGDYLDSLVLHVQDGGAQIRGIAADTKGAIYLTGTFSGTLNMTGDSISSVGAFDMFVAKLAW